MKDEHEGNAGVEKERIEKEAFIRFGMSYELAERKAYIAGATAERERYIAALKEQNQLVEYAFVAGRSKAYSWAQFQEDHKSAIDNAKKFTDGH